MPPGFPLRSVPTLQTMAAKRGSEVVEVFAKFVKKGGGHVHDIVKEVSKLPPGTTSGMNVPPAARERRHGPSTCARLLAMSHAEEQMSNLVGERQAPMQVAAAMLKFGTTSRKERSAIVTILKAYPLVATFFDQAHARTASMCASCRRARSQTHENETAMPTCTSPFSDRRRLPGPGGRGSQWEVGADREGQRWLKPLAAGCDGRQRRPRG